MKMCELLDEETNPLLFITYNQTEISTLSSFIKLWYKWLNQIDIPCII